MIDANVECGMGIPEPWKLTMDEFDSIVAGGIVYNGVYYTGYGEPISIGGEIDMGFLGRPTNMPYPWKLIEAKNVFSTVNYKYNVSLTVEAANGNTFSVSQANHYSPHGNNHDKYFNEFLANPIGSGPHARIVKKVVKAGHKVPKEVLDDYLKLEVYLKLRKE